MEDYNEEIRRSGLDRREKKLEIPVEQRLGMDQRILLRRQRYIVNKLKKTPVFQNLTEKQFKKILRISAKKDIPKDAVIYNEGSKSDDMCILLEGILQISFHEKEVNIMTSINIVGEMGMFNGEMRSASVTAKSDCTLLRLSRAELFEVFKKDKDLHKRFQSGIIYALSEKLKKMNETLAKLRSDHKI